MVRGLSTMGLAGPALVKAATGEDTDNMSLGGADLQVDRVGLADLGVDDENAAFDAAKRFLSYLPSNARAERPTRSEGAEATRIDDAILDLVPTSARKVYDVRKVLAMIADSGSVFELKPTFAGNLVTAFARLGGRPVGFIANQPQRLGGMLDANACDKGAHFLALCDAYGLPLVSFIDVPGFSIGSGAERTNLGRRSAKLIFEWGHVSVPRVSVVLRKGYGLGYFAMSGGRSFAADACFAWPTAEICAMSIEGAIDVAFRKEYERAPDPQKTPAGDDRRDARPHRRLARGRRLRRRRRHRPARHPPPADRDFRPDPGAPAERPSAEAPVDRTDLISGFEDREVAHQGRVELAHVSRRHAARRAPAGDAVAEELRVGGDERLFGRRHIDILVDRLHGTDRDADAAIDAFVGLDIHHAAALVDALYGADLLADAVLHIDAGRGDDVGHHRPCHSGARFSTKAFTPSS